MSRPRLSITVSLLLSIAALAGGPGPARAEPEPEPEPVMWSLFGQLGGATEHLEDGSASGHGHLGIAADLWRHGYGCRQFEIGGQAGILAGDGLAGDFRQWAGVCMSAKNGMYETVIADIRHLLEWDRRPSLFSRRSAWRRRYRKETIHGQFFRIRIRDPDMGPHQIIALDVKPRIEILSQRDGAEEVTRVVGSGRAMLIRWEPLTEEYPMRATDLFGVEITETSGDADTSLIRLIPGGVEAWRVAPSVLVDAEASYHVGHVRSRVDDELQDLELWGGNARLYRTSEHLGFGVEYGRSVYPSFDQELALEDRVTAWLSAVVWNSDVTLRGFAARTEIATAPDPMEAGEPAFTGGAGIEFQTDPTRRMQVAFTAEAARSFYADFDGERTPRSQVGFQAQLSVSVLLGETSERVEHRVLPMASPTPNSPASASYASFPR